MKLVYTNEKTLNTTGKNVKKNLKFGFPSPTIIEWPMSKPIMVGKRSDGYQILQALQPLFNLGWFLQVRKGEEDDVWVELFDNKGRPKRHGEGSSFSVAARRMTIGLSKEFSHMAE